MEYVELEALEETAKNYSLQAEAARGICARMVKKMENANSDDIELYRRCRIKLSSFADNADAMAKCLMDIVEIYKTCEKDIYDVYCNEKIIRPKVVIGISRFTQLEKHKALMPIKV